MSEGKPNESRSIAEPPHAANAEELWPLVTIVLGRPDYTSPHLSVNLPLASVGGCKQEGTKILNLQPMRRAPEFDQNPGSRSPPNPGRRLRRSACRTVPTDRLDRGFARVPD